MNTADDKGIRPTVEGGTYAGRGAGLGRDQCRLLAGYIVEVAGLDNIRMTLAARQSDRA